MGPGDKKCFHPSSDMLLLILPLTVAWIQPSANSRNLSERARPWWSWGRCWIVRSKSRNQGQTLTSLTSVFPDLVISSRVSPALQPSLSDKFTMIYRLTHTMCEEWKRSWIEHMLTEHCGSLETTVWLLASSIQVNEASTLADVRQSIQEDETCTQEYVGSLPPQPAQCLIWKAYVRNNSCIAYLHTESDIAPNSSILSVFWHLAEVQVSFSAAKRVKHPERCWPYRFLPFQNDSGKLANQS